MTENPYRLARDIRGIGFKSADAIAMKLGIEKTAVIRLRAGISYALTEAMDEGHCGLPTDQLIPLAEELLEAPRELILTALELERSEGAVIADKVGDTACIFLAGLYRAEQAIAERLIRVVNGRLPWPWIDEEKALPWVEKRSGLQLADSQRAATISFFGCGPILSETPLVMRVLKVILSASTLPCIHPRWLFFAPRRGRFGRIGRISLLSPFLHSRACALRRFH